MPKNLLAIVLLIPALAVSYYFAVALPAHNQATLEFEKLKYNDKKAEEKEAAEETLSRETATAQMVTACIADADNDYSAGLKRNGTPSSKGGYSIPTVLLTSIERKRDAAIEECHRQYK